MKTEDIILEKISELKELWHKVDESNIEFLINGFIEIWNSMIIDWISKEKNFQMSDFLKSCKIIQDSYFIQYRNFARSIQNNWVSRSTIDYELINENDTQEVKELKEHNNKVKFLLNALSSWYFRSSIKEEKWWKKSKYSPITNEITKSKDIVEDFNKGTLNKEEEQLFIKIQNGKSK